MPDDRSLHYLLCWNHEFVHDAIRDHNEIIDGHHPAGMRTREPHRVWWGKFWRENRHGISKELEVWEDGRDDAAAKKEVRLLNERIKAGHPVHLYIHDPNWPQTQCHVARVLRAHYGPADTLPPDAEGRPACARIPGYYFDDKNEMECNACRKTKTGCKLRYECRFWFLVDALKPNPRGDFYRQLYDTNTGRKVDFAISLFYPLLVEEKPEQDYFDPKRKARLSLDGGAMEVLDETAIVKEREAGKREFLHSFFDKFDDLGRAKVMFKSGRLRQAAIYPFQRE